MANEKGDRGPSKAAKLIAGMVAVATLLGGVAAMFQISDSMRAKPKEPVATKDTKDGRTVNGPAGSTLTLPLGWSLVNRSVLEATVPGFKDSVDAKTSDVVFLEGPDAPGEPTHLFGIFVARTAPDSPSVSEIASDLRSLSDCLAAEVRQTPAGPIAYALNEHHIPDPDGRDVVARSEQFVWTKGGQLWSLTLSAPVSLHFRYSEEFIKIADSVTLP